MATSFIKKSMAYLGLVNDYDGYNDYGARRPWVHGSVPPRSSPRTTRLPPRRTHPGHAGDGLAGRLGSCADHGPTACATPGDVPVGQDSTPDAGARVHIVAPARFADAVEIANRLMANQPVIVNMQTADRDLQRRMIDFCSGATYALSGGMERVASKTNRTK